MSNVKKKLIVVDGENCYGSKLHSKLMRMSNVDIIVVIGKGQTVKDYNKTKVKNSRGSEWGKQCDRFCCNIYSYR